MHSTLPRDPCINFSTAGLSNGRHFSNIIYILVPVPLSYPGVPLDSTIARSGPRSRFKCAGQEWQCYYGVVKVTTQGSRATAGRCTAPCGRGPEATTATATAATIAVAAMRAVAECRHRRSALPAPPPSPPRRATASERRVWSGGPPCGGAVACGGARGGGRAAACGGGAVGFVGRDAWRGARAGLRGEPAARARAVRDWT